jgi:tRNA threonylcarbamoyladenosine biosynthesis protein TsaE
MATRRVQQVPVTSLELATSGPGDTRTFATALAPLLIAGDVVALSGELGAGKTCFAQGAIRGLGVESRVTSPTFVLVRHYLGRLPIVHADVYRLDRLQDVHDLGDDVLAHDVVTFLEWADAITPLLPDQRLEIEIGVPSLTSDVEEARTVTVRGFGARWADAAEALAAACAPWTATPPSAPDAHQPPSAPGAHQPGSAPGVHQPGSAPDAHQPGSEDR